MDRTGSVNYCINTKYVSPSSNITSACALAFIQTRTSAVTDWNILSILRTHAMLKVLSAESQINVEISIWEKLRRFLMAG